MLYQIVNKEHVDSIMNDHLTFYKDDLLSQISLTRYPNLYLNEFTYKLALIEWQVDHNKLKVFKSKMHQSANKILMDNKTFELVNYGQQNKEQLIKEFESITNSKFLERNKTFNDFINKKYCTLNNYNATEFFLYDTNNTELTYELVLYNFDTIKPIRKVLQL